MWRLTATASATLVMLLCVAAGANVSTTDAATSPCGTDGAYYVGGDATGITQYGVSGDIETQVPALCGGTSGSQVWVAEEGHEPAGTAQQYWGIAQSGYYKIVGGGVMGVAEWCLSHCSNPFNFGNKAGSVPSGSENYTVEYNSGAGDLEMWQDGTRLAATPWDPLVSWVYPWQIAIEGETTDCESDVPGTQSNPVSVGSIQKMADRAYDWNQLNDLTLRTPSCSRYHKQWVSEPASFKIWTDPLN